MRPHIDAHFDQFLTDLQTVVNIDSGSGQSDGLAAVAGFFEQRFSAIGWQTHHHRFADGKAPCLEAVSRPLNAPDDHFDFLLLGHMDTVFPAGTAAKRPFRISNGRAWGPGVCDMKGGLVTILHIAEVLQQAALDKEISVCAAFNGDEEVGSLASRSWIEALARKSRRVLVYEPWRTTGQRVIERKGVGDFELICRGEAAHAGAEPDKGANAVVEMARQILIIDGLENRELGTTVNVTTTSGGIAKNVIPEYATAGIDCRFANPAEAQRVENSLRNLQPSCDDCGVSVTVEGGINRMPMVPSDKTRQLWDKAVAIGQSIGMEMALIATGGASDGNFTAALDVPTLDAMGPRGGNAHRDDEYVELDSIVPNLHLSCELIRSGG